jgi:hypothetical protein
MDFGRVACDSIGKLAYEFCMRIATYEDAIRTAMQASDEHEYLRHQSGPNLRKLGLTRATVASEVFRKFYADQPVSGSRRPQMSWEALLHCVRTAPVCALAAQPNAADIA